MTREAGFSLLETIVMLVVVGLLVTGLAEGTRAGLSAWSTETRWSRVGLDGGSTARVLRGLITAMDPGDFQDPLKVTGSRTALAFATDLPTRPPGQRTREATVAITLDHTRLLMRWTLRIPAPIRPPATHEAVLASGITSVAFSYWHDGAWSDRWTGDGLPRLVRVRLVGKQEIPDIVAAPFRAPLS